jgi:hypothetical protein
MLMVLLMPRVRLMLLTSGLIVSETPGDCAVYQLLWQEGVGVPARPHWP